MTNKTKYLPIFAELIVSVIFVFLFYYGGQSKNYELEPSE